MFADHFAASIDTASLNDLEYLAHDLWKAYDAGSVADDEAQELAERLERRRRPAREERIPVGIPPGRASIFPPRRMQRSPDPECSLIRRNRLAVSGALPPALAQHFAAAPGQLATLRIVADEVRDNAGQCVRSIEEKAARAGVSPRTVQRAIRKAAEKGWLTIEERRRDGRRNDYNIVRIISDEWLAWIRRRHRKQPTKGKGSGCQRCHPTDTRSQKRWKTRPRQRSKGQGAAPKGAAKRRSAG